MRSVLIFIILAGVVGCRPAEEPAPTESTESPMVPASLNAVDVESDISIVEFENDLVRVVRMTYPEGYATPEHNHYAGVNILLSDIRAASGPAGEESEPAENERGVAAWADTGEPHVTTNLGGEMQLIRVELKIQ